jgi:hypothetical protein
VGSSSGFGRRLDATIVDGDLIARADVPWPDSAAAAMNDWFWGGGPPTPVQIPYAWLTPPVRFRPDPAYNVTTITRTGGAQAFNRDPDSVDAFGETEFTATLDTAVEADLGALGSHILRFYATQPGDVPRTRAPQLVVNLLLVELMAGRSGLYTVLDREIGDRIAIAGTPVGAATAWPQGTTSLVIEGIEHRVATDTRYVLWNTAPVIGASPGVPGPWFRLGASRLGGADTLPF